MHLERVAARLATQGMKTPGFEKCNFTVESDRAIVLSIICTKHASIEVFDKYVQQKLLQQESWKVAGKTADARLMDRARWATKTVAGGTSVGASYVAMTAQLQTLDKLVQAAKAKAAMIDAMTVGMTGTGYSASVAVPKTVAMGPASVAAMAGTIAGHAIAETARMGGAEESTVENTRAVSTTLGPVAAGAGAGFLVLGPLGAALGAGVGAASVAVNDAVGFGFDSVRLSKYGDNLPSRVFGGTTTLKLEVSPQGDVVADIAPNAQQDDARLPWQLGDHRKFTKDDVLYKWGVDEIKFNRAGEMNFDLSWGHAYTLGIKVHKRMKFRAFAQQEDGTRYINSGNSRLQRISTWHMLHFNHGREVGGKWTYFKTDPTICSVSITLL